MDETEDSVDKSIFKPLWINLAVLGAIIVLYLPAAFTGQDSMELLFLLPIIAVFLGNAVLFLIYIATKPLAAGIYLCSAVIVLLVGLFSAEGLNSIAKKNHKYPDFSSSTIDTSQKKSTIDKNH